MKRKRKGRGEMRELVGSYTADFLQFWGAYPRKDDKLRAFESWCRIEAVRPALPVLLEAVERAKLSREWQAGYIPYPKTWLNARRWEDETMPALPVEAKKESVHELRSKIAAAESRIEEILSHRVGAWGDVPREMRGELAELRAKVKEWKRKLLA